MPAKYDLKRIYRKLLKEYGPQGWWPLLDVKGTNPTKTGSIKGYHPGDYSYPRTRHEQFEICVGAILTQNTSWPNVEKALLNLNSGFLLNPKKVIESDINHLSDAIRPAGYFNQKAKKLKIFSEFYQKNKRPTRTDLLNVWGIGPETADSILLFAYKVPSFVVDAYTKRILINQKIIEETATYDEIKALFEKSIEKDYMIYQEFHALLVEHAKRFYLKKPYQDKLFP